VLTPRFTCHWVSHGTELANLVSEFSIFGFVHFFKELYSRSPYLRVKVTSTCQNNVLAKFRADLGQFLLLGWRGRKGEMIAFSSACILRLCFIDAQLAVFEMQGLKRDARWRLLRIFRAAAF
jgi:hypothetical protein